MANFSNPSETPPASAIAKAAARGPPQQGRNYAKKLAQYEPSLENNPTSRAVCLRTQVVSLLEDGKQRGRIVVFQNR